MPGRLFGKKQHAHVPRRDERYQTEGLRCPAGKVVDLSSSGMRIRSESRPKLRRGDMQSFALSAGTRRLTVQGTVAWVRRRSLMGREYEIGVRFVNLSPSMRTVLKNLAQYGFLGRLGHDGGSGGTVTGTTAQTGAAPPPRSGAESVLRAEIELDDYYNILGVSSSATADEIRVAYRRLAAQHHPDAGGSAEQFVQINKAWSVLKDAGSRARYDQMIAAAGGTRRSA